MGKNSNLLIDDNELLILQSKLAVLVGVPQAIVVQQLHYWNGVNERIGRADHFFDGQWWVYNTWELWRTKNFPFWSDRTIRRTFRDIEAAGLIVTRQDPDRHKGFWTALNYGQLEVIAATQKSGVKVRRFKTRVVKVTTLKPLEGGQSDHLTGDTTETTLNAKGSESKDSSSNSLLGENKGPGPFNADGVESESAKNKTTAHGVVVQVTNQPVLPIVHGEIGATIYADGKMKLGDISVVPQQRGHNPAEVPEILRSQGLSADPVAATAVASQPATQPSPPIPAHPPLPSQKDGEAFYTPEGARQALLGKEAFYRAVCELGYAFTPKMNNSLVWSNVNFYQGKVSGKKVGTDWDTYKIDFVEDGVTPAMIAGFAIWWDYTYNRGRVGTDRISYPGKPEKIYEHFERYAADKHFERCIERGEERLRDLMNIRERKGEFVDKAIADAVIVQMVGKDLAEKIRE